MNRSTLLMLSVCALAGATTGAALAGDLAPPAGPVSPTMKDLVDVEPRKRISTTNTPGDADSVFRISESGSYYLGGSVPVFGGRTGIEIAADNVTLDLNGFSIISVDPLSLDGIATSVANLTGIVIRNGSIESMGGDGIDLRTQGAAYGRIERVVIRLCDGNGITASGNFEITGCHANANGAAGILAGTNCVVSQCDSRGNFGAGYNAGDNSVVSQCLALENGSTGILVQDSCAVVDCVSDSNGGRGIHGRVNLTVTACSVADNTSHGIEGLLGCKVSDCAINSNDLIGVFLTAGGLVTGCSSYNNQAEGIMIGGGGVVTNCFVARNISHGIRISDSGLVTGNSCETNGIAGVNPGAGIIATGRWNRIDSNVCVGSDVGIDVDSTDNIVVRNNAADNTLNYDIAPNNHYGPIINLTVGGTPAAVGNGAGSTIATTDPWANFAH